MSDYNWNTDVRQHMKEFRDKHIEVLSFQTKDVRDLLLAGKSYSVEVSEEVERFNTTYNYINVLNPMEFGVTNFALEDLYEGSFCSEH